MHPPEVLDDDPGVASRPSGEQRGVDGDPHFIWQRVVVAVTGAVAACQMPGVLLAMRRSIACEICVVASRSACKFVRKRSLALASGAHVYTDTDWWTSSSGVLHLTLTRGAEVLFVMPASANVLGMAAAGMADDLVTTMVVGSSVPVVFVPSMNDVMWRNPLVQRNVATLRGVGHAVVDPTRGIELSDHSATDGAMPSVEQIVADVLRFGLGTRNASAEAVTTNAW